MMLSNWILCLLCIWTFLFFGAFCTYIYSLTFLKEASQILLRRIERTSASTFQNLHSGSINSLFGVVPYVTINATRFRKFINSENLNEFEEVKRAKIEYKQTWQRTTIWLKTQIILLIVFAIAGLGIVVLIQRHLI